MNGKFQTYHFGRISIVGANTADKENFLMSAFSAIVHEESKHFRYLITNAKVLIHNGERFIYGELNKYKLSLEVEIIDEEEKQRTEGAVPYGFVAASKFFIHLRSQIIAYHPIISRISDNQFNEFLARLIEAGHHNFFISAEVDPIDEDIKITESISLLKKISKIFFEIRPTNPSNRPVYRTLDDRLKRLEAEKEQRTIISSERGLNAEAIFKDEIYMGVVMAADGYGKAIVYGERDDGTDVVITTDDAQVTKQIADNEDPIAIIAQLFETFIRIWQRTHPDEYK